MMALTNAILSIGEQKGLWMRLRESQDVQE